jgi:hypothetical protein
VTRIGSAARRSEALVPDWLAEVVRLRRDPVPWADMVRAAVAICAPLAVAIAIGNRPGGVLVAMGGLLGTVVDKGGPYLARVKRVGSAAVFGGAAGLLIGSLIHGRGWIAVVALMLVAGVSAVMSAAGDVGSITGLQLLVYASLGLGPLGGIRPWWHVALGFVIGTAWALILTVPGWLLSPRAAEQRSVAAVYRALATLLNSAGAPGLADRVPADHVGAGSGQPAGHGVVSGASRTGRGRGNRDRDRRLDRRRGTGTGSRGCATGHGCAGRRSRRGRARDWPPAGAGASIRRSTEAGDRSTVVSAVRAGRAGDTGHAVMRRCPLVSALPSRRVLFVTALFR